MRLYCFVSVLCMRLHGCPLLCVGIRAVCVVLFCNLCFFLPFVVKRRSQIHSVQPRCFDLSALPAVRCISDNLMAHRIHCHIPIKQHYFQPAPFSNTAQKLTYVYQGFTLLRSHDYVRLFVATEERVVGNAICL